MPARGKMNHHADRDKRAEIPAQGEWSQTILSSAIQISVGSHWSWNQVFNQPCLL